MVEWLEESLTSGGAIDPGVLAVRLLLALALGGVVGCIYAATQRRSRPELLPFATTLVLLTILIAMVTLVIGNSVARAFSLVGALAIVRFRTVVEDTRDTAYVIFAVVVGMAAGAGFLLVPLVGIPIVAVAAVGLSRWGRAVAPSGAAEYTLVVRVAIGRDPEALFRETFDKHLAAARLRELTTARQGAALDVTYRVRLRRDEDAVTFCNALNQVAGVQNVELRQL
jgi:uncharacterized membrane protein YhiD involved in acid resistance